MLDRIDLAFRIYELDCKRLPLQSKLTVSANETRLDEVARRGAHVMPFRLEQTTHIFTKTETGGVQQVVVKNPSSAEQSELIRDHLATLSDQFARGDFSDSVTIHDATMPGLAALQKAKPAQINVEYQALADGAQIEYTAKEPRLVSGNSPMVRRPVEGSCATCHFRSCPPSGSRSIN